MDLKVNLSSYLSSIYELIDQIIYLSIYLSTQSDSLFVNPSIKLFLNSYDF